MYYVHLKSLSITELEPGEFGEFAYPPHFIDRETNTEYRRLDPDLLAEMDSRILAAECRPLADPEKIRQAREFREHCRMLFRKQVSFPRSAPQHQR